MSDVTAQHLASNLKRMREARGWSQQQLADFSGVPRPTIANLESGEGNPTLNVMVRITAAIGSTLEELISDAAYRFEVFEGESLPSRVQGDVVIKQLYSDVSGIDIERFELASKARCTIEPSRKGLQLLLSCEHGRVEVRVKGETARLKTSDVLRWRGGVTLEVESLGARPASLVVVTLPLPLGW
jgi:transcriptional regulator with XRE-family HTH domain